MKIKEVNKLLFGFIVFPGVLKSFVEVCSSICFKTAGVVFLMIYTELSLYPGVLRKYYCTKYGLMGIVYNTK